MSLSLPKEVLIAVAGEMSFIAIQPTMTKQQARLCDWAIVLVALVRVRGLPLARLSRKARRVSCATCWPDGEKEVLQALGWLRKEANIDRSRTRTSRDGQKACWMDGCGSSCC